MIRHLIFLTALLAFGTTNSIVAQTDNAAALRVKIEAAMDTQNFKGALEAGKALLAIDPKDALANFAIGYALHSDGQIAEAIPYHEAAAGGTGTYAELGAYNAGCAYARTGNPDKAFEWLDKAVALGFASLQQLRQDTDLKSLHSDPRYSDLVTKLGGKPTKAAAIRVLSQNSARMLTRVSAFTTSFDACLGEIAIEYGPVAWKDDFQKNVDAGKYDGQRWRLGMNFWTNLDSNVPFTLGEQKFAAGDYYLVLERSADTKKYLLTLIPSAEMRKVKADAFEAESKAKGGVSLEMTHSALTSPAPTLSIVLAADSGSSTSGKLTIEFGPNRLTAPFAMQTN